MLPRRPSVSERRVLVPADGSPTDQLADGRSVRELRSSRELDDSRSGQFAEMFDGNIRSVSQSVCDFFSGPSNQGPLKCRQQKDRGNREQFGSWCRTESTDDSETES